jgi:hypothetical protein
MNPQIIQLAVLVAAFWFTALALAALYFFRKLQLQQRLLAIERGADPAVDREGAAARTRRAGIVCVAAGLGLCLGGVIIVAATRDPQAWALQAVGIVPIAVGLGLLVDYRLARRDAAGRPERDGVR